MSQRNLKYVFAIFCMGIIIFPLLNIYSIFPRFEGLAIRLAEKEAAIMVAHMTDMLVFDGKLPGKEDMPPVVRSFVEGTLELSSVKLYDTDGGMVYAYPETSNGGTHGDVELWERLKNRDTYSVLKRAGMRSAEGEVLGRDMLETYVPIFHKDRFLGVFEVYHDITGEMDSVRDEVFKVYVMMVGVLAFVILLVTLVFARMGGRAVAKGESTIVRSPLYQMAVVAVAIFVGELVVMFLLPMFDFLSAPLFALFDATLLLIISVPLLYFFLFRPLRWLIAELERSHGMLEGLVEEKEALSKEVVNRVTKNLNAISGILSLQSRRMDEGPSREAVETSLGRVNSMAIVQEIVYASMQFPYVRAGEFVRQVSTRIFKSNNLDASKVSLMFEVEDILLDIDSAVACGMILNELIVNAGRHAFPGERKGEVMVSLKGSQVEGYVMNVSDNGAGVPDGMIFDNITTLGLTLVKAMAQEIDAEIYCDCSDGTKVSFRFGSKGE